MTTMSGNFGQSLQESVLAPLGQDAIHHILACADQPHDAFVLQLVCRDFCSKIRKLHPEGVKTPLRAVLSSVARLQWVLDNYPPEEQPIWLRIKGSATCACDVVAEAGRLDVLQCLRANGCRWDRWTCARAALGGHLEALQWARANGCPWDSFTCSCAAEGGHLEVLQWARANGCPWAEDTCARAALRGHLEVLQWARANGCLWNKWTCNWAAMGGHLEVLQWARDNGCPEA